jgi:hypothetical protein
MDVLSKRYAHPCFFLNGVIQTGRLDEFVDEFGEIVAKEEEERRNWEFFLHKVFEGSYSDFVAEIEDNKRHQNMSARTIETTVQHTNAILRGFNPERRGE